MEPAGFPWDTGECGTTKLGRHPGAVETSWRSPSRNNLHTTICASKHMALYLVFY